MFEILKIKQMEKKETGKRADHCRQWNNVLSPVIPMFKKYGTKIL